MMGLSSHLAGDDHSDLVCLARPLLTESLECIVSICSTTQLGQGRNKKIYRPPDLAAYGDRLCRNYVNMPHFSAARAIIPIETCMQYCYVSDVFLLDPEP